MEKTHNFFFVFLKILEFYFLWCVTTKHEKRCQEQSSIKNFLFNIFSERFRNLESLRKSGQFQSLILQPLHLQKKQKAFFSNFFFQPFFCWIFRESRIFFLTFIFLENQGWSEQNTITRNILRILHIEFLMAIRVFEKEYW